MCWYAVLQMALLILPVNAREVSQKDPSSSSGVDEQPVSETIKYVPIGHRAAIKCESLQKAFQLEEKQPNTSWFLLYNRIQGPKWKELTNEDRYNNKQISVINSVVYLYGMTATMSHSVLECSVKAVAQDCGDFNSERTENSMNKLNPCRYGSCHLRKRDGFQLLECRCLPQFTGLFCDKLANRATHYEILFYSPIFAIICVLLYVACCFPYMEGIRREKPMAFEKHIPLHHHSLDMKKNYTAMFVTPQQYAKLAATAHGEETEAMSASLKKSEQSAKKKHRTKPRDRSGSALTAPTQFSVEEVGREDAQ